MTAQIEDKFIYHDKEYKLVGISGGKLFEPSEFDIEPEGVSTDCYRGYLAYFAVSEGRLTLDNLHVNLFKGDKEDGAFSRNEYVDKEGPEINGVKPLEQSEDKSYRFNNIYQDLNYQIDYSGGLLIADKFIQDLYVHMGFQPAWKYEKVIELTFENGILQEEVDQSEKMAKAREKQLEAERRDDQLAGHDGSVDFINDSFDRSYD